MGSINLLELMFPRKMTMKAYAFKSLPRGRRAVPGSRRPSFAATRDTIVDPRDEATDDSSHQCSIEEADHASRPGHRVTREVVTEQAERLSHVGTAEHEEPGGRQEQPGSAH